MPHINIEIKAKSGDAGMMRSVLESRHAIFKGVDHQIDTYFKVSSGRLKLREGNIENYLIHYERSNIEGPKQSTVTLFANDPKSSLKEILIRSLDVLAVVDKTREIYFIDNVKFHIDTVKDLGTFVEIEAIDETGTIGKETLLEQCNAYLELFGISSNDLISGSYSDLLIQKTL